MRLFACLLFPLRLAMRRTEVLKRLQLCLQCKEVVSKECVL